MSVTLKEIAERAGCSVMAVSATLNNGKGTRVSENTRARIKAIADEMGYLPNLMARSLSGGASNVLGVIIDSHAPASYFRILRFLEQESTRLGYHLMIGEQHDSPESIKQIYRRFEQYKADGIICLAHDYPKQKKKCSTFFKDKKNVVFLNTSSELNLCSVTTNPDEAFKDALAVYRMEGKRNALLIADIKGNPEVQNRIASYRKGCAELGLEPSICLHEYHTEPAEMMADVRKCLDGKILKDGLTGLLMQSDLYAAYMLSALHEKGIKVPEEIAVTGWDNLDFGEALIPPLATIDNDHEQQAKLLLSNLLDMMAGKEPCRYSMVKSRFIPRASCGAAGLKRYKIPKKQT